MGLSIHYSGQLKDAVSLLPLIEEVEDICSVYGWNYRILEPSFPANNFNDREFLSPIYGSCFTPPEYETISLTFLSNGVMVCPARVTFFGNSKSKTERNYIYHTSVKTQFAGITTHAIVINLFRYLSDKYFTNFKMTDESLYWETGDENVLRKNFKQYNDLLENFSLSLQTFPVEEGEDLTAYFERLLKYISKPRKS
jgi:hypothetical protein